MGCSFKAAGSNILGKSCDILDSVLLIDTFFVLFRSFRGRYTGLIVPEGLF